jgi:hypothetical protein
MSNRISQSQYPEVPLLVNISHFFDEESTGSMKHDKKAEYIWKLFNFITFNSAASRPFLGSLILRPALSDQVALIVKS